MRITVSLQVSESCVAPQAHLATVAGSRLLHESLAFCQEDPAIRKAKLHVHVGNEEALLFYQRQGFNVGIKQACLLASICCILQRTCAALLAYRSKSWVYMPC